MKKLLIADDQAGIRMLLSEVFKNEGYETILATNGLEAIQKLEEDKPDCLLLDMKMPGMDGDKVLQQVKNGCPSFPIVMMTAYDELETSKSQSVHKADYYFTKPFDIHEVRRTINHILQDS